MSTELRVDPRRQWWCKRCGRTLTNDRGLNPFSCDTVTATCGEPALGAVSLVHDQCGGEVCWSKREAGVK